MLLLTATLVATMPARDATAEGEPERAPLEDTAAGLAPAGVDLNRPLLDGEVRLSYRFLGTWQKDNFVGSSKVTAEEVQTPSYTSVPDTRDRAVHIVGLDWAPHARVTLAVRLPVLSIDEKETSFAAPPDPDLHSDGVGDFSFGILVPFMRKGEESTSVALMIGAPTGSTPIILAAGFSALIAVAMPAISPPPPMATSTVSTSRFCFRISSATVPWPAITAGSAKGCI